MKHLTISYAVPETKDEWFTLEEVFVQAGSVFPLQVDCELGCCIAEPINENDFKWKNRTSPQLGFFKLASRPASVKDIEVCACGLNTCRTCVPNFL